MPRAFFDTNIFLYADDRSAPEKKAKSIQLISEHQAAGQAVISLQVLQEYYSVATRKLGVEPDLAHRKVQVMARSTVVRFHEQDISRAITLHRQHQVSFWDAMIILAADSAVRKLSTPKTCSTAANGAP